MYPLGKFPLAPSVSPLSSCRLRITPSLRSFVPYRIVLWSHCQLYSYRSRIFLSPLVPSFLRPELLRAISLSSSLSPLFSVLLPSGLLIYFISDCRYLPGTANSREVPCPAATYIALSTSFCYPSTLYPYRLQHNPQFPTPLIPWSTLCSTLSP